MCRKRCTACGELFTPRRNVPNQTFCSKPQCQRERKRRWHRNKLKQDPDYRTNQAVAQQRWRERHQQYWRDYRKRHPEYAERNRKQQRERNRRGRAKPTGPSPPVIAKSDEYPCKNHPESGTYQLIPVMGSKVAKIDAYLVKIQLISDSYTQFGDDCKEMT